MINNYIKIEGARFRQDFFVFDDKDPASVEAALFAARTVMNDPNGRLSVWRQLKTRYEDITCIGHAPTYPHLGSGTWRCANCGQLGTRSLPFPSASEEQNGKESVS